MWDAAVDWVTATAPLETPEAETLEDLALSALGRMQHAGHTLKPRSWEGYAGLECGNVFFGRRDDGVLAKVTSAAAHPFVCELAEKAPRVQISRIDLQVTLQSGTDKPKLAREILTQLEDAHEASGSKRPLNVEYKRRKKKGDCLWIGARTSPRFYRIYDKTRDQDGKIPPNLWRYEVEFKGKQAKQIWRTMTQCHCSLKVIVNIVVAGFLLKGIDLSWIETVEPRKLPSSYSKTTTERQLNWMERDVSRTSKELIAAGWGGLLSKWLGFDDVKPDEKTDTSFKRAFVPLDEE
jgi:hypothetical protein